MTSNGYSPLTVTGLDPGIMYTVIINVFDGNKVVLTDQIVMRKITVMSDQSGNYNFMYICTYIVYVAIVVNIRMYICSLAPHT